MTCLRAYISLFILLMGTNTPHVVFAEEDPIVAIVNQVKIFRSELEDARMRLPDRLRNIPLQSVYGMLVNSLVNTKLVAAEARKINLQNDERVRTRISRIEDQILERAFLETYIESRITEKLLAEHYEKLIVANSSKEEIQARHILLEKEAEAYEVIKELQKGGDFAELAKKHSTGPSASKGGNLGYFAEGQMVPAFSKAAFSLKKGEITTVPVRTEFGWHIIKLEDRRPLQPLKRAEIEDQLRAAVSQEIGTNYLKELRQTADIKQFNLDGSPLMVSPPVK